MHDEQMQELKLQRAGIAATDSTAASCPAVAKHTNRPYTANLDLSSESITSDFWTIKLPAEPRRRGRFQIPSSKLKPWLMYFLVVDLLILAFVMLYQVTLCAHLMAEVKSELARVRTNWENDGFYTCTEAGKLAHALPIPNDRQHALVSRRRV